MVGLVGVFGLFGWVVVVTMFFVWWWCVLACGPLRLSILVVGYDLVLFAGLWLVFCLLWFADRFLLVWFICLCLFRGWFVYFCDARLLILGWAVWCGLCFELLFRFRLVDVNSVVLFRLFLYVLC